METISATMDFYPRPPRGGRRNDCGVVLVSVGFLSTPSARRATFLLHLWIPATDRFLSTPSARRATSQIWPLLSQSCISIHALREEGDRSTVVVHLISVISIHALREEGDKTYYVPDDVTYSISIHALREEGDGGFSL